MPTLYSSAELWATYRNIFVVMCLLIILAPILLMAMQPVYEVYFMPDHIAIFAGTGKFWILQ